MCGGCDRWGPSSGEKQAQCFVDKGGEPIPVLHIARGGAVRGPGDDGSSRVASDGGTVSIGGDGLGGD